LEIKVDPIHYILVAPSWGPTWGRAAQAQHLSTLDPAAGICASHFPMQVRDVRKLHVHHGGIFTQEVLWGRPRGMCRGRRAACASKH